MTSSPLSTRRFSIAVAQPMVIPGNVSENRHKNRGRGPPPPDFAADFIFEIPDRRVAHLLPRRGRGTPPPRILRELLVLFKTSQI